MLWSSFPLAPLLDNHEKLLPSKIGALLEKSVETKESNSWVFNGNPRDRLREMYSLDHRTKLTGESWDRVDGDLHRP